MFRQNFERVRSLYNSRRGTWLAIDIEAWEKDHTAVTEFGWSILKRDGEDATTEDGHWIVKENRLLRNGQYVPDARDVGQRISLRDNITEHSSSVLPLERAKLCPSVISSPG